MIGYDRGLKVSLRVQKVKAVLQARTKMRESPSFGPCRFGIRLMLTRVALPGVVRAQSQRPVLRSSVTLNDAISPEPLVQNQAIPWPKTRPPILVGFRYLGIPVPSNYAVKRGDRAPGQRNQIHQFMDLRRIFEKRMLYD
jgi:hypothetical protein